MSITFKTTLLQAEGKNATGIRIPSEVIESLGAGKKPRVKVTLNSNYTYSITVAVMGSDYMIGFSSDHRQASGLKAGDPIEVALELDKEPPAIIIPDDLVQALDAAGVRAAFDALAPSARKNHVYQVSEAKTAETRARRIDKIVGGLR
ncbi:MAG: YdeI/OmpD-associated family protein [Chloroflexota bacterium]|nr:YdeI/OmpD-associated family protein [Chloroflexota bacterium]